MRGPRPPAFRDRRDAGRVLGGLLGRGAGRERPLVLGLPRGGVPVAWEVARALGAALDVLVVRKLGVPGREELAMGAIAGGGALVLNDRVTAALGVGEEEIARARAAELRELERRERLYRGRRGPVELAGRTVILVDDGLATGATMRAATLAARGAGAGEIVVAVPVGARQTCAELRGEVADEVVCIVAPRRFGAVGAWYRDFGPTSDDEVQRLLAAPPAAPGLSCGGRQDPREGMTMTEQTHEVHVHLTRERPPLRHAVMETTGDEVTFGTPGWQGEHYGFAPGSVAPHAGTLDYLVASVAGCLIGTFGGALTARGVASDGDRLVADAVGAVGVDPDGVLVLRRIVVRYTLRAGADQHEAAERAHAHHARVCPNARSVAAAIEIVTELDFAPVAEEALR